MASRTCDVRYDDGDTEVGVKLRFIKPTRPVGELNSRGPREIAEVARVGICERRYQAAVPQWTGPVFGDPRPEGDRIEPRDLEWGMAVATAARLTAGAFGYAGDEYTGQLLREEEEMEEEIEAEEAGEDEGSVDGEGGADVSRGASARRVVDIRPSTHDATEEESVADHDDHVERAPRRAAPKATTAAEAAAVVAAAVRAVARAKVEAEPVLAAVPVSAVERPGVVAGASASAAAAEDAPGAAAAAQAAADKWLRRCQRAQRAAAAAELAAVELAAAAEAEDEEDWEEAEEAEEMALMVAAAAVVLEGEEEVPAADDEFPWDGDDVDEGVVDAVMSWADAAE